MQIKMMKNGQQNDNFKRREGTNNQYNNIIT